MFMKADITFSEVEKPLNNWCSCGHTAPETFKREGAQGKEEPIKFFRVSNKDIDIIICEPCLIIANYMARQQKKVK